MTVDILFLLFAAGLLGGAANAMAGGATLITFPAMLAAGLPPITANASNAASVIFGNLMGVIGERKQLQAANSTIAGNGTLDVLAAICGGALGGILLLATPDKYFEIAVPLLIGVATLIFAFAKPVQAFIKQAFGETPGHTLRTVMVFLACIYGGYFGAGLGVILMAVLSATTHLQLRPANAVKNLFGVLANLAAIAYFIWSDVISYPQTAVMIAGCVIGGLAGARLLKSIPASSVRSAIIIIGTAMTVIYAWKYWF